MAAAAIDKLDAARNDNAPFIAPAKIPLHRSRIQFSPQIFLGMMQIPRHHVLQQHAKPGPRRLPSQPSSQRPRSNNRNSGHRVRW
jgi:hypothetical protein